MGCEQKPTDPASTRVNGEIAHIRGLEPKSARHDPDYLEPNGFWNLVILCPNHHKHVDYLEPTRYDVAYLEGMKARHEERAAGAAPQWATDSVLAEYARRAIKEAVETSMASTIAPPSAALDMEETRHVLADSINRMGEKDKIVLTLYFYEGLTVEEIATVLGVKAATIKARHRRAVSTLADTLAAAGLGPATLRAITDLERRR